MFLACGPEDCSITGGSHGIQRPYLQVPKASLLTAINPDLPTPQPRERRYYHSPDSLTARQKGKPPCFVSGAISYLLMSLVKKDGGDKEEQGGWNGISRIERGKNETQKEESRGLCGSQDSHTISERKLE